MVYRITAVEGDHAPNCDWTDPLWDNAQIIRIDSFRQESSSHRPLTEAKMVYNAQGIYVIFRAHDQYVRCVQSTFQSMVCEDSCVEVYFHPRPHAEHGNGYINLEMSGNGTLLSYYITDAERAPGGFKAFTKLTAEQGAQVRIVSTLPPHVEPELSEPTQWQLGLFIPFSLIEQYTGALGEIRGQHWRCNLFKCADQTSRPHWASWQPVPELNFHMPHTFGEIYFA